MIDQTNDNQCPLEPWAKLHPKNQKKKRTTMNIFKRLWKKLWSKTEIDEKVVAAAQETKRRAERVAEELKDEEYYLTQSYNWDALNEKKIDKQFNK